METQSVQPTCMVLEKPFPFSGAWTLYPWKKGAMGSDWCYVRSSSLLTACGMRREAVLTSIFAFHPGAQGVRALWPAETRGPLAFRGTI